MPVAENRPIKDGTSSKATIVGKVIFDEIDHLEIPVQIQLLNKNLSVLTSFWTNEDKFRLENVPFGINLIRLCLASGIKKEEVLEITSEEILEVTFRMNEDDMGNKLGLESFRSNLMFQKAIEKSVSSEILLSETKHNFNFSLNFWTNDRGILQNANYTHVERATINDSEVVLVQSRFRIDGISIRGEGMPTKFICVPHRDYQYFYVSRSSGPVKQVHPLKVILFIDDWRSEALLSLLSKGGIREEASLLTEAQADALLVEMQNPGAAAIVGYYLLKTGGLVRMHDWANDLARRFSWMPDGAIIHAWQLLAEKPKDFERINLINNRLLQAVKRGIPIYTEGLRLLYEGLQQYSLYYGRKDYIVELALKIVKYYVKHVDWSEEYTTLIRFYPEQVEGEMRQLLRY